MFSDQKQSVGAEHDAKIPEMASDLHLQRGAESRICLLVSFILVLIPTGVAPYTLHGGVQEQYVTSLSLFEFLAGKNHPVFAENNFGNMSIWKLCTLD